MNTKKVRRRGHHFNSQLDTTVLLLERKENADNFIPEICLFVISFPPDG